MVFAKFGDIGNRRLRVPGFQVLMTIGAERGIGSHQAHRPLVIEVARRTAGITEDPGMYRLGLLGVERKVPADLLVAVFTRAVSDMDERLLVAGTAIAAEAGVSARQRAHVPRRVGRQRGCGRGFAVTTLQRAKHRPGQENQQHGRAGQPAKCAFG